MAIGRTPTQILVPKPNQRCAHAFKASWPSCAAFELATQNIWNYFVSSQNFASYTLTLSFLLSLLLLLLLLLSLLLLHFIFFLFQE